MEATLTVDVGWSASDWPQINQMVFKYDEELLNRIEEVQGIVEKNKLSSARIGIGLEFLRDGEEVTDWYSNLQEIIVHKDCFWLMAYNKYDSGDQYESTSLKVEELRIDLT